MLTDWHDLADHRVWASHHVWKTHYYTWRTITFGGPITLGEPSRLGKQQHLAEDRGPLSLNYLLWIVNTVVAADRVDVGALCSCLQLALCGAAAVALNAGVALFVVTRAAHVVLPVGIDDQIAAVPSRSRLHGTAGDEGNTWREWQATHDMRGSVTPRE